VLESHVWLVDVKRSSEALTIMRQILASKYPDIEMNDISSDQFKQLYQLGIYSTIDQK